MPAHSAIIERVEGYYWISGDPTIEGRMDRKLTNFSSARAVPLRILVTGFGKFPGARRNPTALLVHALGSHQARLARLGIELKLDILPVNYAGVASKLEQLNETLKPDAILHFGLAARRKFFSTMPVDAVDTGAVMKVLDALWKVKLGRGDRQDGGSRSR